MSNVYFAGDLHLGHNSIAKYRTRWKDSKEHDSFILDMISDVYKKRHTYWLLGDICFTEDAIKSLRKVIPYDNVSIVLGNHDTDRDVRVADWVNHGFTNLHSLVKYKEFWLSHAPIHPYELRGKHNIHGHTHYYKINDDRYIGVSLEQTDFSFIGIDQVRRIVHDGEHQSKHAL